jgi:S-formylglutathione hydrolase FrmB
MTRLPISVLVVAALATCGPAPRPAPLATKPEQGRLVRATVHARSLENTLTGESADRHVSVYLPPSYDTSPDRRYPVLYLLHGITDTDQTWTKPWSDVDGWQSVDGVMDRGIAERRFDEMIVVMPDARTNWGGSFYTSSPVTGNWEDFIVRELVAHVDATYRTLATAANRGIAGHSMGGYGAIKLGMLHPDVFSVVYGINPAVLGWGKELSIDNPAVAFLIDHQPKTPEEVQKGGLYAFGIVVLGQAFSPNPARPPLYFDLPAAKVDGKVQKLDPVYQRWTDHMPLYMIDKHVAALKSLRGLRFDSGYDDEFEHIPPTARALSAQLTKLGVDHVFEEYNGDHRNRMMGPHGRLATEIFPYFSRLLSPRGES